MKHTRTTLAALALLITPLPGLAQSDRAAGEGRAFEVRVVQASETERGVSMVSVSFPGGTLAEFVEAIAERADDVSVVVNDDARQIPLPAINLQNALASDVLHLPQFIVPNVVVTRSGGQPFQIGGPQGRRSRAAEIFVYSRDEAAATADAPRPAPPRFDIEFDGGSVKDYLDAVRAAHPSANIVAMPGLERFPMPQVKLEATTLEAAVMLLRGRRAYVDQAPAAIDVRSIHVEGAVERMYVVEAEIGRPRQTLAHVWSVAETLTLGVSEEDMLTAVEAAMELYETPVKLRFHRETSLLMAHGSEEQIGLIDTVLSRLWEGAHNIPGGH